MFNGRAWLLQKPPRHATTELLALKLIRKREGSYEVTTAGMNTRAVIARSDKRHMLTSK
jgi:hypothetical protein